MRNDAAKDEVALKPSRRGREGWLWLLAAYGALVLASLVWMGRSPPLGGEEPPASGKLAVRCPDFDDDGPTGGLVRVAYREWGAPDGTPLILIHGSPGSSSDFKRMAPLLAQQGRRVIAPDLPGFGDSTRQPSSYSIRAHARSVVALMDALGVAKAHVLGWSMGGGVVLHMTAIAPDRVESLTLLAAIGDQRTEGSGSYEFEHAKYTLGEGGLLALHALVPHFGLIPSPRRTVLYSLVRNFGDTDQRALTPIMEQLRRPTLIIAGRDDFLVPLRASELQHELIGPSRLVVMDAMHFMPFLQAEETSALVGRFIDEDAPRGAALARQVVYEAPPRGPPFGAAGRAGTRLLLATPWWALAAVIAVLVWRRPFFGAALSVALVNALLVDWGVGLLGVFSGTAGTQIGNLLAGAAGRGGYSRTDWERRFARARPGFWLAWRATFRPDIRASAPRAVGGLVRSPGDLAFYSIGAPTAAGAWTLAACLPLGIIAALISHRLRDSLGWAGTLAALLLLWLWVRSFMLLFTWTGRRMLLGRLSRARRHEYWPSWIFYAPLVPYLVWLALRHRHPLAFSACNPGIPGGGGLIGESKSEVQSLLAGRPGLVVESVLIEACNTPEERTRQAMRHIGEGRTLGEFPVVLKPDAGLRGFAVRIARTEADVVSYFREMTRPAMVQRYHAGPHEIGVMWARCIRERQGRGGMIYAVTRKDFPFVVGDGKHTLEQLIYRHPRYRCQARIFLERFADDASCVPAPGERVRLAQAGNHCQGTLFRDGADLATPDLLRAMDELALTFANGKPGDHAADGGLDIGRFDLRFHSEEDLRAGRNFGIIELNGTTGEATNLYDPDKSLAWAYRVLFGQWRLLYELGAWRMERGATPWTPWMLIRSLREFYRDRPGSAVAD